MRMRCGPRMSLHAASGVLALAVLATFVAPATAATVLFQDTFTYPNPAATPGTAPDYLDGYSLDINAHIDHEGRQSGSLVDLNGPITYSQANHDGGSVIGFSGAQQAQYEVIQTWTGGNFTPNMNFNNDLSDGGLIISFDTATWGHVDNHQNITTVSLGLGAPPTNDDPAILQNWNTAHFSFEYGWGDWFGPLTGVGAGVYGLWDSGTAIVGGGLGFGVNDDQLRRVTIVCTDTSGRDNNPFDGAGNTHIEVYLNPTPNDTELGVLVGSFTKGAGGYADNYLTLGSYGIRPCAQIWDNLTITQTNIVGTLNQWAGAASGNWSDATKWTLGVPAGGQGDIARFRAASSADTVVTVTEPVTVGTLVFDNIHSYTIQSSNPSVNTITLDNTTIGMGEALIQVNGGSHTISAPLEQVGNLNFATASNASLDISGSVAGNGYNWTLHGPGVVNLTGTTSSLGEVNLPYSGTTADVLNVTGSSALLSAGTIIVGERGIMTVSDGGSVTASGGATVNHRLTVTGAGSSFSAYTFDVFRPYQYDDGPVVEVSDGGFLSSTTVSIDNDGVGGSWVVLSAGGTIDTLLVYGDGVFNFNGGELDNTMYGTKTNIDVLALVFTNGGSYSLDPSETITTSELLGRYDASTPSDGTFTFNGGSLQCRPDPRGLPNYIGAPGQLLTHVYVNAPSTIYLSGETLSIYQPLEGDGNLQFSSGKVNLHGDNSSWSGSLQIDPSDPNVFVEVVGNNPNGLGTKSINMPFGSSLEFINGTESMVVANSITLNGPGNSADSLAVALAWDPYEAPEGQPGYTLTLSGALTVHNEENSGAAPDVAAYYGSTFELNGLITDGTGAVGGLTIGNGANGYYYGGACRISGSASNAYRGDTSIQSGLVFLNKDFGKTAIPSSHIYIGSGTGHTGHAGLVIEGVDSISTQLNPAAVITFNQDNYNEAEGVITGWVEFSMNGHFQTVGGLDSPEAQRTSPMNAITNTCTLAAAMRFADYPRPTTLGTLTVNTVHAGDDYTYSGKIFDGYEGDMPLAIVKDGPGTQRFVPGFAGPNGIYAYTGGTTVKAGTLDVSAVGLFTPNSPITLEGGTLIAGNELSGEISRLDSAHSGTLVAGGDTFDTLMLRGAADIGAAVIDADHTLILTAASNVIDHITGAGSSTLQVASNATLTSSSITLGTLTIGGDAPMLAPTSVPEPSMLVFLIATGLAFLGGLGLRKS